MSIFSSKKKIATIKSLIASGTTIYGDIVFSDGLRIDGEVRGNIQSKSEHNNLLVISESAYIEGEIRATHIIAGGHVKGPIYSSELLELQPKARIEGDVEYIALEVHQGASVVGQFKPRQKQKTTLSSSSPTVDLRENNPNVAYPGSMSPSALTGKTKTPVKL